MLSGVVQSSSLPSPPTSAPEFHQDPRRTGTPAEGAGAPAQPGEALLRNLRSEAAKLAEAEGFDYIVIDDGSEDLPTSREMKMSLEGQVLDQFQRRRMLYANPAYDLTDKLIVRMNNARAAGAPAPATTAPNAK